MAQSMTHVGVAAGKNDKEAEGATTVVYDAWNLGTYDPDSDGTGNDFDPRLQYGFSRLQQVNVEVADGQAYLARYDYVSNVIRLYAVDGTGEVGAATTVNVDLRVEVRGN